VLSDFIEWKGFQPVGYTNCAPRSRRDRTFRNSRSVCHTLLCMKPSVIVWDLETVPDLAGFAAANDLVGKRDADIRAALGNKKS
jgi:hypothetical protein